MTSDRTRNSGLWQTSSSGSIEFMISVLLSLNHGQMSLVSLGKVSIRITLYGKWFHGETTDPSVSNQDLQWLEILVLFLAQ